jgi:hypothetical protein
VAIQEEEEQADLRLVAQINAPDCVMSDEEGPQADTQAALDEEFHDFLLSNSDIYGGYVMSDEVDGEYIMDFCQS